MTVIAFSIIASSTASSQDRVVVDPDWGFTTGDTTHYLVSSSSQSLWHRKQLHQSEIDFYEGMGYEFDGDKVYYNGKESSISDFFSFGKDTLIRPGIDAEFRVSFTGNDDRVVCWHKMDLDEKLNSAQDFMDQFMPDSIKEHFANMSMMVESVPADTVYLKRGGGVLRYEDSVHTAMEILVPLFLPEGSLELGSSFRTGLVEQLISGKTNVDERRFENEVDQVKFVEFQVVDGDTVVSIEFMFAYEEDCSFREQEGEEVVHLNNWKMKGLGQFSLTNGRWEDIQFITHIERSSTHDFSLNTTTVVWSIKE